MKLRFDGFMPMSLSLSEVPLQSELHLPAAHRRIGLPEKRRRQDADVVVEIGVAQYVERIHSDIDIELAVAPVNRYPASEVNIDRDLSGAFTRVSNDTRRADIRDAFGVV